MDNFATGYAIGQNDGRNNSGGFGDFGGGWLWIIVLFALMFGGFGFGGLGGFGGFGGFGGGAGLQGMATRADITAGFQFQELQAAVRGIERGITDATYALNNTVVNGFHGVERELCDIGRQISDCCCENRAAIADLKFASSQESCATRNLMQSNTRDIIDATNAGFRMVMDRMAQSDYNALREKYEDVRTQNLLLNQNNVTRAMFDAGVAEVIRRTGYDYPVPSYLVQPPTPLNFPTNGCGQVQFGGRSSCQNQCPCG